MASFIRNGRKVRISKSSLLTFIRTRPSPLNLRNFCVVDCRDWQELCGTREGIGQRRTEGTFLLS
jgi:hypothetical protein